MSAVFGAILAWARTAAEAWERMLYLAKFVDSSATSTSMILLFAARRFVSVRLRWSSAKLKRLDVAPLTARRVAMFSSAVTKKLTPNPQY